MLKINLKKIAEDLIPSFYEAGKESIKLSGKNLKITIKKDNTPVTNGDLLVDKILQETISDLTPNIQIVSCRILSTNKSPLVTGVLSFFIVILRFFPESLMLSFPAS